MNDKPNAPTEAVRLQKALADAGLGSRREIEHWIRAGRLQVNGQPAQLGQRVRPEDRVQLDGRPLRWRSVPQRERRVLLYNKPEGELVSRRDPQGRPTVFDRLPPLKQKGPVSAKGPAPAQAGGRWIAIGRLDLNTSGLLLFTNDGELANRLMHPSHRIEREYAVRVQGLVSEAHLRQLTHGVQLEDGPARFEEIVDSGGRGQNHWYHLVLCEGRNREVRRLWAAVGLRVSRLKRVRYGPILLDARTPRGRWRELTEAERQALYQLVDLSTDSTEITRKPSPRTRQRISKSKSRNPN